MKIELKTVGGSLIFEGDFSCIADAVKAALKAGKSLRSANLSYANLSYANLSSANLSSADLRYANLSSADLRYADLSYANLSSANLSYANLRYADLSYANLSYAKNSALAIAMTRILPSGTLTGWKKLSGDVIAQLEIPAEAKRSHAFGRKCRAEFAQVVALFKDGKNFKGKAASSFASNFIYEAGKRVEPTEAFCDDWTNECASGIHFFITKEEAEAYVP